MGGSGAAARALLEHRLFGLEVVHARLHRALVHAVLDRPDQTRDLARDRFQSALVLGRVPGLLGGQPVDLLLECAGELFDQLGGQQAFPQSVQHAALQLHAPDLQVVAAGALAPVRRAAVVRSVDDREPAAAHAALEQAAQQVLAPVRAVQGVAISVPGHDDPHLGLARLDGIPQLVADDAQLGHRHDLPLLGRVRPGDLLARARVLDVRAAVPFDSANIQRIVEDAGAAIDLTADRGVAPLAPARSRYALGVQLLGDRARTDTGGEQLEDAHDHRRLGGVDAALPGTVGARRQHVVPVCFAAGDLALQRPTQLTPLGLLAQVLQVRLRHHAQHRGVHRGDLAHVDRVQPDSPERQPIVQVGDIGELATQPVQGLDDDHVEPARFGIHLHLLEGGSKPTRPAQRIVGVDLDDLPALEVGMTPADLDLIVNRRLALVVRAVARVDRGAKRLLL